MLSLLPIVVLLAIILYFMVFWAPGEQGTAASATVPPSNDRATQTADGTVGRFTAERCWYGITLHGYEDEYRFETKLTARDLAQKIREFYLGSNATILIEDPCHLRFSRARNKLLAYLTGLDTWFPHEVDASFQTGTDTTQVVLRYFVPGWHIRIPPNQLRKEAGGLLSIIQTHLTEPAGGTAAPVVRFGPTPGPQ